LFRRPASYRHIASHLRQGGLIAYPTESCYGLGCDPRNYKAVQNLLRLKRRPKNKGLILIASCFEQVARYLMPLDIESQAVINLAGKQAVTYLIPATPRAPHCLRGDHDTLAVRLTGFKAAVSLCQGVGHALVSTSANRTGKHAVKSYAICQRLFGHHVWVLHGTVGKRKQPSSIRVWPDGKIVRN
jgi:L-threonylcarbamoyladenylate synthase